MSTRQSNGRVVELVAAISVNGKITDGKDQFKPYSSPEDRQWLKKKIAESDVIMMGRKTSEKAKAATHHKPCIIFTRQVEGIQLEDEPGHPIHWFNDSKEELLNLCDLLQYQRITVLGGSEIYYWAMQQDLLTDIYLTVEPFVMGQGKNLLDGSFLLEQRSWKLKSQAVMNDRGSLLLHYQQL